jgi:hypothetical protein
MPTRSWQVDAAAEVDWKRINGKERCLGAHPKNRISRSKGASGRLSPLRLG